MVELQTLNYIGLAVYAFCTLGYHGFYAFLARRHPMVTVKGKVERYRKDWVDNVLQSRNILMAVQTVRNNIMAVTWLASSLLLVLAFFLTSGLRGEESAVFRQLGIEDAGFLRIKVDIILAVYGFGFLMFLFTVRHLVLFNTLIGTSPDLITQTEGIDAAEYLAQLLNRSQSRFTYGLRATYFSIPTLAWLFSTWAFIVTTIGIWLWLVLFMDTRNALSAPKHRPHM